MHRDGPHPRARGAAGRSRPLHLGTFRSRGIAGLVGGNARELLAEDRGFAEARGPATGDRRPCARIAVSKPQQSTVTSSSRQAEPPRLRRGGHAYFKVRCGVGSCKRTGTGATTGRVTSRGRGSHSAIREGTYSYFAIPPPKLFSYLSTSSMPPRSTPTAEFTDS
jgi:hypothetical protein